MSAAPLPLKVPLHGLQSIEASAGTGKTETMGLLMLRALLDGACEPQQLLAVTFTRKATHELRERLRSVLHKARRVLDGGTDDDLASVAVVVNGLLETQPRDALSLRVRKAQSALDRIAIHTIHAFCQRVLGEYPQQADLPALRFQVLEREAATLEALALGLWRGWMRDDVQSALALSIWSGPESLARDLPALLGAAPLLDADAIETDIRLQRAALQTLAESIQTQGAEAEALVIDALDRGVLNGNKHQRPTMLRLFALLREWAQGWGVNSDSGTPLSVAFDDEDFGRLQKYRPQGFTCNKGKTFEQSGHALFVALAAALDADTALIEHQRQRRARFLADARRQADAAWRKISQRDGVLRQDDLIRRVAQAVQDEGLVAALRARYRLVLVDEFQDTDAQQWSIFSRLFAHREDGGLLLVGDPKQAIYGFRGGDIQAYRAALERSDGKHALRENFRSQPALIDVVNTLYRQARAPGFIEEELQYTEVSAAGPIRAEDWQHDGAAAPALEVRWISSGGEKALNKDLAQHQAMHAMSARITLVLDESSAYRLRGKNDPEPRRVRPGDIAVLVGRNAEVDAALRVLREAGIPARGVGRASVYETAIAEELLHLLSALIAPRSAARAQAACATWLVGDSTQRLREYLDGQHLDARAERFAQWRARWQAHGALALLESVLASHPGVASEDGECRQRLRDIRQLCNLLQALHGEPLERQHQHLLSAIHSHLDREDATQRETGAGDAVQVMTVHLSKGLQFPLVFLPSLWNSSNPRKRGLQHVYDAQRLRRLGLIEDFDASLMQLRDVERQGEARRQLYVALTRASHAMWWCWGAINQVEGSALHGLLHGGTKLDAQTMRTQLQEFLSPISALAIDDDVETTPPALHLDRTDAPAAPPAPPRRDCRSDWWVHSFSQWHKRRQIHDSRLESASHSPPAQAFAGRELGLALHHLLEHQLEHRGKDAAAMHAETCRALRYQGFAEDSLPQAAPLCLDLYRRATRGLLPEGLSLDAMPVAALRHEMEFHLSLRRHQAADLFGLLAAHQVIADDAKPAAGRIEGLLTGKIDLIYLHQGRYFVADYKSNWLPAYDEASLRDCMQRHEYFLQATLYALAVHRWLRFRLGAAYDYRRDVGGLRYLFPRGMSEGEEGGVLAWKPEPALIDALDTLFGLPEAVRA